MGVGAEFSGPRLIGRPCALTSRSCQLIGVRSRFEERSWTGERDRGGTSRSSEEHGVGPDNRIHRLDRFYMSFFRALNVNTGDAKGDSLVWVNLGDSRVVETSGSVRKKKLIES